MDFLFGFENLKVGGVDGCGGSKEDNRHDEYCPDAVSVTDSSGELGIGGDSQVAGDIVFRPSSSSSYNNNNNNNNNMGIHNSNHDDLPEIDVNNDDMADLMDDEDDFLDFDFESEPINCNSNCDMTMSDDERHPNNTIEHADMMIAREMNALSEQEREDAKNDLHGNCNVTDHDPEFVKSMLEEMDLWIERKRSNFKAYNLALLQNPSYVKNPDFRLCFLFKGCMAPIDPKAAAERILTNFEYKLDLFGHSKLCKDICMDDLDEDDLACLRAGNIQHLGRDHAGRPVILHLISLGRFKKPENMYRCYFYTMSKNGQDPIARKKGVVEIMYNVAPATKDPDIVLPDHTMMLYFQKMIPNLNYYISALHHVVDSPFSYALTCAIRTIVITKEARKRSAIHYGVPSKWIDSMQKRFGIVIEGGFPIDDNGIVDRRRHVGWVIKQQKAESVNDDEVSPEPVDVLLGRGKGVLRHSGNLRLRDLLERNFVKYEASKFGAKERIASDIVEEIYSNGGRFLKRVSGKWTILPQRDCVKKVGHDFRTLRQSKLKARNEAIKATSPSSIPAGGLPLYDGSAIEDIFSLS